MSLKVRRIREESEATRIGIKIGDDIIQYDGRDVAGDSEQFIALTESTRGRSHIEIKIWRNYKIITLYANGGNLGIVFDLPIDSIIIKKVIRPFLREQGPITRVEVALGKNEDLLVLQIGSSGIGLIIYSIIFIIAAIIGGIVLISHGSIELLAMVPILIIFLAVMLTLIWFQNIYTVWKFCKLSELEVRKYHPTVALLLFYVPIINLVWSYFAFSGPTKHLSNIINGLPTRYAFSERQGLPIATAVFFALSFIPPFIFTLIFFILYASLVQKWFRAEQAILEGLVQKYGYKPSR